MRQFFGIVLLIAIVSGLSSCYNTEIKKPEKLIPKDKFEKMMVDIYLIDGIQVGPDNQKDLKRVTHTDLYFSILKKYNVSDTVFIRSLIYYSSFLKEYEKMHVNIIKLLNESEQQFNPKEKLQTEKQ